jgi:UPF0755 protein
MKKRRIISYLFLIILITGVIVGWKLFGPVINSSEGKYLYIRTNGTYHDVKDSLLRNKIISGTWWFDKVSGYLHYDKGVKPGRYRIEDGMGLVNLVRMLRAGNQAVVKLVITKLRTKEDFAKKIGDNFECDSTSVMHFLNSGDSISKYNVDTNTVITAIIPNTYTFTWNNNPSKIFKKLYNEQQIFWTTERKDKAAALHLTPKEVYILSSIVEEETNKDEDKGKIASVYLNRIHQGMKLAADPTVKFAMRDFGLKRILFKHLSFNSSYNTYQNNGLPPGPICTPSIKTIDAVLNMPATDYLYFVAKADFSGYSNFSSGYEEHLKNAKAYQQVLDSIIMLKQQSN